MRKSYSYEVIKKISDSGKKELESGSGLRFLTGYGSRFDEYGSKTLHDETLKRGWLFQISKGPLTYRQCCESRSSGIRNFFLDPELFVSDPEQGKIEKSDE